MRNKMPRIAQQDSIQIRFRFRTVQLKCQLEMKLIFCVVLSLIISNLNVVNSDATDVAKDLGQASCIEN